MDVQELRWFIQVAGGATVTQVAEASFISQSAVSRALGRLEAELRTPLLMRSGRVLRLTPAGEVFLRRAQRMLAELDEGLADVARTVDPEAGLVTLAFQQSLAGWLVPDLLRSFRSVQPRVEFALSQIPDDDHAALTDRDADLELSTRRVESTGYDSALVVAEPLTLAVPNTHRLARRRSTSLTEAVGEPFIGLRPDATLRQLADQLCRDAGFEATTVFEADDLATVRGLVGGGLGVAVVPAPRALGRPGGASGAVRHASLTDAGARREVRLVWRDRIELTVPSARFRDHVLHRARRGSLPELDL